MHIYAVKDDRLQAGNLKRSKLRVKFSDSERNCSALA
jgi:hypothetical protein